MQRLALSEWLFLAAVVLSAATVGIVTNFVTDQAERNRHAAAEVCAAVNQTRAANVAAYEIFRKTVNAQQKDAAKRAAANKFFDRVEAVLAPVACTNISH